MVSGIKTAVQRKTGLAVPRKTGLAVPRCVQVGLVESSNPHHCISDSLKSPWELVPCNDAVPHGGTWCCRTTGRMMLTIFAEDIVLLTVTCRDQTVESLVEE
jgi:hypothetical protein